MRILKLIAAVAGLTIVSTPAVAQSVVSMTATGEFSPAWDGLIEYYKGYDIEVMPNVGDVRWDLSITIITTKTIKSYDSLNYIYEGEGVAVYSISQFPEYSRVVYVGPNTHASSLEVLRHPDPDVLMQVRFTYNDELISSEFIYHPNGVLWGTYYAFSADPSAPYLTGHVINPRITSFTLDGVELIQGTVPEPATWAMLIAGFSLVGATARRRRDAFRPAE